MNTTLIKLFALVFILPVFIACRQKKAHPVIARQAPVTDSTHRREVFSQNPAHYYFHYDSTKDDMYNLDSGYVDTFAIAGTRFRFLFNRDTTDDDYLEMQVYKNGQWASNFRTLYANNGSIHEDDLNNDGFTDFQQFFSRYWTRVYLYDPIGKKFVDTPLRITGGSEVVDKKTNLYYDSWDTDDGRWISVLYQFKGLQRRFLYTLKYMGGENIPDGLSYYRLYKCRPGDPGDTVLIKQFRVKPADDPDIKDYWKAFVKNHRNL